MRLILLFFIFSVWQISFAQNHISGVVTDKQSGNPIPYSVVKSINSSTYTDLEGKFGLPLSPNDSVLVVRASFYQQREIILTGEPYLVIELLPEEQSIEAITVSAMRIESRLLNTTGPVSLITGSQLARNSAIALEPSLNQVPGVYMHTGSLNTNRITIRGIGSRTPYGTSKIKAYLDDIPLTSGDGETTLEDISLLSLSQVEIVRGPASGIYGSGLGGAILLRTLPGSEALKVQANFMSGSYATHKQGISVSSNREKSSHLLVTDFTYSDGYRENNRYNRSNLFSYNRFEIGENGQLSVLFDFVDLKAYIPSSIDYQTFMNSPRSAAANWAAVKGNEDVRKIRGATTFRHKFSEKTSFSLTAMMAYSTNLELRPFNLLKEESLTGSTRFSIAYKKRDFEWNTGTELFVERYDWSTFRNQEAKPENRISDNLEIRLWNNLFSLAKWIPASGITIEPGINLNYTQYNYTDRFITNGDESGKRRFPLLLSPRLGTNWQTSGSNAIYALISHGFSSPSLQETLQPDGQVNPEIKPETGWNFEVGIRGKLLNNNFFYDVSVYRMLIRNLLVARRTGEDAFVGVNAGKTTHNGIELDVRYFGSYKRKIHWNLFTNGTFAFYRFDDFTDLDRDYSGNKLTGVPPVILNSGIEVRTNKGWNTFLNFRHSAKLPLNDANTIYSDGYQIVNWRLGKGFRLLNLDWKFNGGINNLFNTHYASMYLINAPSFGSTPPRYYYPGLPRNYYLTIQVAFIN